MSVGGGIISVGGGVVSVGASGIRACRGIEEGLGRVGAIGMIICGDC